MSNHTSSQIKSFTNNTSSMFDPNNRVTILDDSVQLSDDQLSVLRKGPGFVPSSNVTNKTVLLASVGVENLAYSLKWDKIINSDLKSHHDYVCGSCNEILNTSCESIFCDGPCKSWFHVECSLLSKFDLKFQMEHEDSNWFCSECTSMAEAEVHIEQYSDNDRCGSCSQFVRSNEKGICCEGICGKWFHIKCINLSTTQYKQLTRVKTKWACDSCYLNTQTHADEEGDNFTHTFSNKNTIFPSDMPFKDIPKHQPKLFDPELNGKLANLKTNKKHL